MSSNNTTITTVFNITNTTIIGPTAPVGKSRWGYARNAEIPSSSTEQPQDRIQPTTVASNDRSLFSSSSCLMECDYISTVRGCAIDHCHRADSLFREALLLCKISISQTFAQTLQPATRSRSETCRQPARSALIEESNRRSEGGFNADARLSLDRCQSRTHQSIRAHIIIRTD